MAKSTSVKQKPNLAFEALSKLSDDDLSFLSFALPMQYGMDSGSASKDVDGFPISNSSKYADFNREELQVECWNKFNTSPHLNTAVRGEVGRLAGFGFEISSEVREIQDVLEEEYFDQRNRLYNFLPKYVGRAIIEGELFLCLTVHRDSFIEIDFIDPSVVNGGTGCKDGIFYHPSKTLMPVIYNINGTDSNGKSISEQIPSIYVARYPEILKDLQTENSSAISDALLKKSKEENRKFHSIGNFKRFIVSWDRSFISDRNSPYLRTVIEWLNFYEQLKKYEIDHKKSSGAYLWVVSIEDPKTFRTWISLTDEDRRKTGIMAKKTPGGTLVLPPGMTIKAVNPQLPKISDTDTDILHMVTSGLNEPEDVSTGQSKGTFASVKASRGPMSDRVSDEIAYFERYLKHDLFGNIFYLKASVSNFPFDFKRREAVDFKKGGEPIFENVKRKPEFLIDIQFPVSEINDVSTRASAYLGVKHGSVNDVLGIPNSEISAKLGIRNYKRMRLKSATEKELYPELAPPVDAGGQQLEPSKVVKGKKKDEVVPEKPILRKQKGGTNNE